MKQEKYYKQKISIFNFLLILVVTAGLLVFYISNIIYVNNIASENNNIKSEINKVKQTNDLLRTEIEKFSSYERVSKIAGEKFGLSLRQEAIDENNKLVVTYSESGKE